MAAKKADKVKFIDDVLLEPVSRRDDFDREEKEISTSQLRCAKCKKLLAKPNVKGKIAAQIKCPRCGTINEI